MLKPASLGLLCAGVCLLLLNTPAEGRRRPVDRRTGTETAEQWIAKHAIPFATDRPQSGFDDLEPLRGIIGDARIVSLGEATHGTREFFTMKHRMLEFMVEQMGFTVFALEAGLPDCDKLNQYVLRGTGDAEGELAHLYYWPWNTVEVLDMIHWMRAYNERRGARLPVQFRCFDMQSSSWAMKLTDDYLRRVDPQGAASISSLWQCFHPYRYGPAYAQVPEATRAACAASLRAMYELFESRRAAYTARSSAEEFERHLRFARVMQQHEATSAGRGNRDAFMAENVAWLAQVAHPDEKLVLWAHNAHVAAASLASMGAHLRPLFPGRQMVIFGFAFGEGEFNAYRFPERVLGPNAVGFWPGDHDAFLRAAGHPRMFVDLRDIDSPAARARAARRDTLWIAGAFFFPPAETHRVALSLSENWDVVIWFERTTPTVLSRRNATIPPP